MSDIEIANSVTPLRVSNIAEKIGIDSSIIEPYGHYKAKLPLHLIDESKVSKAKMILVTAITPTPAGEGKTTTSIGLSDGLNRIGKKSTVVLREPSLGPVFGMKGGAAGGGYAQVIPMEDINLHFTGDFSAIEKSNNLLSALIDNNLQNFKTSLSLDSRAILWKRVMDMNDRALRSIVVGLGGKNGGITREEGFNITAASEIMAILCLSSSLDDFKERCKRIYIGDDTAKKPVFAAQLEAADAMTLLVKDAIKPNLVQTLEGNPAIIHGGPFANIAQGTNSVIATKMALTHAEFVVTEAGFGSDLGAEKFLDIKCRQSGISPDAVVLVATIRALKYHGGGELKNLGEENLSLLQKGIENLDGHIDNLKAFGLPVVVALNQFSQDTAREIDLIRTHCANKGVSFAVNNSWAKGSEGSEELARLVASTVEGKSKPQIAHPYELEEDIAIKIEKICKRVYGGDGVVYSATAESQLKTIRKMKLDSLPVCIAKTQKSFSDDEKLRGRPRGFSITIREFEFATGAGFIVPIAGNILRMPGLPVVPAANEMKIDKNGKISGLS
jgi:formate--tetrahydrofolate ligase